MIKIILGILLSIMIGILSVLRETQILGIIWSCLIIMLTILIFFKFIADKTLVIILTTALIIRVLLAYINLFIFPLSPGDGDVFYISEIGGAFADFFSGKLEEAPETISGTYLFTLIVGVTYFLFGKISIVPQMIVILLSIGVIYFVYRITLEISEDKRCARIAAIISLVFPTYNLYASLLLRETFVSFFTVFSLYMFILGWNRFKIIYIYISIFSLIIASSAHSGVIFIGGAYALVLAFYDRKRDKWSFTQLHKIIITGILIALTILIFGEQIASKLPTSGDSSAEVVNKHLENYATARAAYLIDYQPAGIIDMFIQTPVRIFYFLFTPFPTMISNMSDVIAGLDACLYLVLTFYGFKGLQFLKNKNNALFWIVLLSLLLALIVFSWGTSNYGAAIRHRQKIACIFIILSSIGLTMKKKNIPNIDLVNDEEGVLKR
ncbi:hypothetical protein bcgnr5378_32720 [Bacillus cereus]|uniref:hypothetical protein n=1 Tax=Bacillus cereus TaxID=1396 RepID=UPI0025534C66|nr:hypothetical protein [Bacillus cereus]